VDGFCTRGRLGFLVAKCCILMESRRTPYRCARRGGPKRGGCVCSELGAVWPGGWRCVAFSRPVLAAEPVTVVPRLPGGSPHSSRLPSAWCIGGDLPDSEGGAARRAGAPHSRWSDEDHLISERMFREYRFVWAYVLHACMLYTASVNPQGGHRFRKSSFRLIVEHVTRW